MFMSIRFLAATLILFPAVANAGFNDVTVPTGVQFVQVPDAVTPLSDPRTLLTSGMAWFDFNNDGFEDLYATQADGCNKLFMNEQDGTFVDVAASMNAGLCNDASRGVVAADIDNDGFSDLFVTQRDQNRLLKNLGGATFQDITDAAGMNNGGTQTNSSSATFGDFDNDGLVDLFVAGYVLDKENNICDRNLLWHNEGGGVFTEVAAALGVDLSGDLVDPITQEPFAACGLATTFSDVDDDGDPDLLIVNDFGFLEVRNQLFRNDGPGPGGVGWVFTDISVASGMDFQQFGMGVAMGDFDNDQDPDYCETTIPAHPVFPNPTVLAQNNGDGTFTDISYDAGVDLQTLPAFPVVNWGTVFLDADNDRDVDLFIVAGGSPSGSTIFPFLSDENPNEHLQPMFSFRNNGDKTFTENTVDAGLLDMQITRGLSHVDFDNDGAQDLYLGTPEGTNVLYRNTVGVGGPNTNWIKVRARGTVGNADAIGAQMKLNTGNVKQYREVAGGSSFLSMNSKVQHFGLKDAVVVDKLAVRFRSGIVYELRSLPANQEYTVVEPTFAVSVPKSTTVPVGLKLLAPYRIENFGDQAETRDVWIDLQLAAGAQTIAGPRSLTLQPGEKLEGKLPRLVAQTPQTYTVILRTGTFPDVVQHQSFLDVTAE